MQPPDLPPLKYVLEKYNLSPKKSLGQNFLLDSNINNKIVQTAGTISSKTILEIGPGPGGLTRALLLAGAKKVVVIEKDQRFLPILEDLSEVFPERLQILTGDAIKINPMPFLNGPVKVIANLPYNISTVLLNKWLDQDICNSTWESLTLMFQYEVAKRITAYPGTRECSRISLKTHLFTNTKIAFPVPATAFTPKPKVKSALVHLDVLSKPRYLTKEPTFSQITKAAFNQRRKMLRSSLGKIAGDAINDDLIRSGITPTMRPEQVSLESFCKLSFEITKK